MSQLVDSFGRNIEYLRVSLTDRCDFRCVYCMSEDMQFLPKKDILTLGELERLCGIFIKLGVRKLRLTGGEPLVRRNVMHLINNLSRHLDASKDLNSPRLDELTLTTNGSQLVKFAKELAACGIQRINVSIDTLDPQKFSQITRWGKLDQVLSGIEVAKQAGLRIKINCVALKNINIDEAHEMLEWCIKHDHDLTFIEVMPMGDIGDLNRHDQYWPLSQLRTQLSKNLELIPSVYKTGGPARYFEIAGHDIKLGFITPMTHNFCESCNRVRLTCTGKLYLCLGQDDMVDLMKPLRASNHDEPVEEAIIQAMQLKPKGHDFIISRREVNPSQDRHMSVTGG